MNSSRKSRRAMSSIRVLGDDLKGPKTGADKADRKLGDLVVPLRAGQGQCRLRRIRAGSRCALSSFLFSNRASKRGDAQKSVLINS
jgi:hypothetical protein